MIRNFPSSAILFAVVLVPNVNYLAYKNALKQAWKDGRMSAAESSILDTLRKSLNISAEEHMEIESNVREELAGKPIENGELEFTPDIQKSIEKNEQPDEP